MIIFSVTPPAPSAPLHRPGNELAQEGYEEDSPAPKRLKGKPTWYI